jgi:hypothetical protein
LSSSPSGTSHRLRPGALAAALAEALGVARRRSTATAVPCANELQLELDPWPDRVRGDCRAGSWSQMGLRGARVRDLRASSDSPQCEETEKPHTLRCGALSTGGGALRWPWGSTLVRTDGPPPFRAVHSPLLTGGPASENSTGSPGRLQAWRADASIDLDAVSADDERAASEVDEARRHQVDRTIADGVA